MQAIPAGYSLLSGGHRLLLRRNRLFPGTGFIFPRETCGRLKRLEKWGRASQHAPRGYGSGSGVGIQSGGFLSLLGLLGAAPTAPQRLKLELLKLLALVPVPAPDRGPHPGVNGIPPLVPG